MLLVDICKLHCLTDRNLTCIRSVESHDQTEECCLTGTVRTDHSYYTCRRQDEVEVLIKQLVSITL